MMDTHEIISEISRLPFAQQRQVIVAVSANLERPEASDAEQLEQIVLERLLAKGIISEITAPMTDAEDDEFQPLEIAGEPISEIVIRERR